MVDLVIRGGTVVDGTGGRPGAADVAVDGGRIVEVGRVDDAAGGRSTPTGCSCCPAGSTSTPTTTGRPRGTPS